MTFGRVLGPIWIDGQDVSAAMRKSGHGRHEFRPGNL